MMSYKKTRNMGLGIILTTLLVVGIVPTCSLFKISQFHQELSFTITELNQLSEMKNVFVEAAKEFNRMLVLGEGDFGSIIRNTEKAISLSETIEKTYHETANLDSIQKLTSDFKRFENATTLYQNEYEADPTADQTDQLGRLPFDSFGRANNLLFQINNRVMGAAMHNHHAVYSLIHKSQRFAIVGLVIVRSLVQLHGGEVWADSGGENRGATFAFMIPAHAEQMAEISSTGESEEARGEWQ